MQYVQQWTEEICAPGHFIQQQQQQTMTMINTTMLFPEQRTQKRPPVVGFANVEIIELPYMLGDNPSVSSGPPVSASWEAQKRTIMDLEFFEQYRPTRRNKRELHLTKEARKHLLLQSGYSEKEIQIATIEAIQTRKQRMATIQEIRMNFQRVMENRKAILAETTIGSSSPMPMRTDQLPPSPIIPRKSPARMVIASNEKLPHLQFPHTRGSILSPRLQRRKRPVPLSLGNDDIPSASDDPLSSHMYNHTPKRFRAPNRFSSSSSDQASLSPTWASSSAVVVSSSSYGASMRLPARVKSPMADHRPMVQPRRWASPPPTALHLYQRSPQPPHSRRAM